MEEAATCPATLTTETLAGAVNNPLGDLLSPRCLTKAGSPPKGGPTHGRGEAGKGQGHCTSDSHINPMLLRLALMPCLPTQENRTKVPPHNPSWQVLPCPCTHCCSWLVSLTRSSFLLFCSALAMTLAMCHAGSNKTTLRQVEEVELPSATGPLRTQSKLQLTPHKQAAERPGLFPTQIPSTAAAQAPREPWLPQAQTQPYLSGVGSR